MTDVRSSGRPVEAGGPPSAPSVVGFPITVIISPTGQILANHTGPLNTASLCRLIAKAIATSHHP